MIPAATREAQATACLEAADHHRAALLSLARKLTGCPEEGMDLYQQTLLNCHEAIQRNGFAGGRYEFYLLTSLKNLYYRQTKHHSREVRVDFQQAESGSNTRNDEGASPWAARQATAGLGALPAAPLATDAHAQLAEQVMAEARQQFSVADRIALRLSVDGLSCRQIAEHIGTKDQSWVSRRLKRMKQQLRQTFQQAWEALGEVEY